MHKSNDVSSPGTMVLSDRVCPQTGLWVIVGQPGRTRRYLSGDRMLRHHGGIVSWVLLQPE